MSAEMLAALKGILPHAGRDPAADDAAIAAWDAVRKIVNEDELRSRRRQVVIATNALGEIASLLRVHPEARDSLTRVHNALIRAESALENMGAG